MYSSNTMYVGDGTWDASRNDFLLPNLVGLNFETMRYNGKANPSFCTLPEGADNRRNGKSISEYARVPCAHHRTRHNCNNNIPLHRACSDHDRSILRPESRLGAENAYISSDHDCCSQHGRLHTGFPGSGPCTIPFEFASWHWGSDIRHNTCTSNRRTVDIRARERKGQAEVANQIGDAPVAWTNCCVTGDCAGTSWTYTLWKSEILVCPVYAVDDILIVVVFCAVLQSIADDWWRWRWKSE